MKRAKIVNDFAVKWIEITADGEGGSISETWESYNEDGKLLKLHERIAGEVVDLVDFHGDMFELIDNNFPIYPELICAI